MDDEEMLRSVVSRMLEIMGYDVTAAADGEEALQLYKEAAESGAARGTEVAPVAPVPVEIKRVLLGEITFVN